MGKSIFSFQAIPISTDVFMGLWCVFTRMDSKKHVAKKGANAFIIEEMEVREKIDGEVVLPSQKPLKLREEFHNTRTGHLGCM
jgi:hypothetical protein